MTAVLVTFSLLELSRAYDELHNYCRHRLTNTFMIIIAKSEVTQHSSSTFVSFLLDKGWPSHGCLMGYAC